VPKIKELLRPPQAADEYPANNACDFGVIWVV
jgi:hypothetical protein